MIQPQFEVSWGWGPDPLLECSQGDLSPHVTQANPTILPFLPAFSLILSSEKKADEDDEDQEEGHRHSNESQS